MASPQLENGYTRIANQIMEAMSKFRMPGQCTQVVFALLRFTYGHQKKQDAISLSRWADATGMKKPNIIRTLAKLREHNVILLDNDVILLDNKKRPTYRFNKNFEEWIPFDSSGPLSNKITTVIKLDNKTLSNKITHPLKKNKESTAKKKPMTTKPKTLSNKITNPDIKILIDLYHELFVQRYDQKPVIVGGRDGETLRRLLKTHPVNVLSDLLRQFIDSSDPFIRGDPSLSHFGRCVNRLISAKTKDTGIPRDWRPP